MATQRIVTIYACIEMGLKPSSTILVFLHSLVAAAYDQSLDNLYFALSEQGIRLK
jgi:hypothetical protein